MPRRVCPQVLEALAAANRLDTAYDGDRWSRAARRRLFRPVRHAGRARSWVTTGTAANCLGLAALCPPHGAILCHEMAHIEVDEAGAPGFFTHGAKLTLLPGQGAKLTPETVEEACAPVRDDVHQVQPAALSITNATEYGLSYRPTRSPRWARSPSGAGSASTWTGRASPMPSPSPAPIRPT